MKPLMFVLLVMLTGCNRHLNRDSQVGLPTHRPMHSRTSFAPALRCMDGLLMSSGVKMTLVTDRILGDPERHSIYKEMAIHALKQMTERSQAIQYIDYDPRPGSAVFDMVRQLMQVRGFQPPEYYLSGATSGETHKDDKIGLGLSMPRGRGSLSRIRSFDSLKLNMKLGHLLNNGQMISPQIRQTVGYSFSAQKSHGSARLSGNFFSTLGLSVSFGMSETESELTIFQSMIELAVIELIGRETQVPYWSCLQLESTEPAFQLRIKDWYEATSERKRNRFAQQVLKDMGYYHGRVDGKSGAMTQQAITRFQLEHQLLPTGRISFNLFVALSAESSSSNPAQPTAQSSCPTARNTAKERP